MTYTLIAHTELTSSQLAIGFTSIPTTFTDLLLVFSGRGIGDVKIRFNGSSTLASRRHLFGTGSSTGSGAATDGYAGRTAMSSFTANTFGNTQIYIPNYRSNTAKSYSVDSVDENNATQAFQVILAGLWSVTDPITSLEISDLGVGGLQFVQYSSATLYGITAGSSGGVVVS
jgi:hypothetical protein